MRFYQQHKLACVTAIYLCVLSMPSLFVASDGFNKAIYGSLILLALVNNARCFFLLLLPFFTLSHVALYYAIFYKLPTDISFWFILFGTSNSEVVDFLLKANKPAIFIAYIFYILVGVFCYKNMQGQFFVNPHNKARLVLIALILIPLSYAPRNNNIHDYALDIYRHFRKAYPQNLVLGYMAAKIEVAKLHDMIKKPPAFYPVMEQNLASKAATYVLVLGESARRDRLGLYGYKFDTTPNMAAQKDLVVFKDMVSYGYNTSTSIPYTMAKASDVAMKASFLSVFKQAGFKVFWLSNQAKYGEFDTLISSYAASADEVHFMSTHSYSMEVPENFDEKLLPYYDNALLDSAPKKLIILHLYGSHPNFDKRYPLSAKKFENSYDNSIYYTDIVLAEILKRLEQQPTLSAMFYLSDHGLSLGECGQVDGHIDAKNSYEVPFFMWFNQAWQKNNLHKYLLLQSRQNSPIHTGDLFDSLTDIAGIHFVNQDNQHSLVSPDYQYHPRMVKAAQQEMDYDKSNTGEGCHLETTKK